MAVGVMCTRHANEVSSMLCNMSNDEVGTFIQRFSYERVEHLMAVHKVATILENRNVNVNMDTIIDLGESVYKEINDKVAVMESE